MVTPSPALINLKQEKERSNGWEELMARLDPAVANTPRAKNAWKKLDRKLVYWLIHTVAQFPWFNQVALGGVIYSESGVAHPTIAINHLHTFLRWAIPQHYPTVAALKPVEALMAYFGDPPQPRGTTACRAYSSIQIHVQDYLRSLSAEEHAALMPFVLPILVDTPRLGKLRAYTLHRAEKQRKEQSFAVVRDLPALVALGRRRYHWLAALESQVRQVAELVQVQQITLPAIIRCQDLDGHQTLTFRVWDRNSWVKAHRQAYDRNALNRPTQTHGLFLQLLGPLPERPWFLRAAELGGLGRPRGMNPPALKYFRACNIAPFAHLGKSFIAPPPGLAQTLTRARKVATGTPEDSRVLFCVEPLLVAAAVGLFVLVCLTQSGMRIGELQQVTGDKNCMKIGFFPQFDEEAGGLAPTATKLFFWLLFPKGSTERQPYPVTPYMQEALKVWMEVHDRFCGRFQEIAPAKLQFTHVRRFPGQHLFVLQWGGKHVALRDIESSLDFLLIEHLCLDTRGQPARVTAHLLRHGVAGYLRKQGVPLEDIAALLHQVNVIVTDYYSKLSPADLFAKLGPFLTRLGALAEIDPSTLRSVGDIQRLGQEALQRFGSLRRIPGGTCAVFTACEVQFKCASCPAYIPDPARRDEVREKIIGCARTAQFLRESGDFLQAEVQCAHGHHWERIEKEMQALAAIELTAPPYESALKAFGLDNLEEVDNDWLLTLKTEPSLAPGGE